MPSADLFTQHGKSSYVHVKSYFAIGSFENIEFQFK